MKRSPFVAVVIGLALVLYIYTSSVKPSPAMKNAQANLTEQIQEALSNIKNSDTPEAQMQGVLQMKALADQYPQNADLQWNMGLFSMQSGQYSKAANRFEKVVQLDDDRLEAHMQLALSYAALKDTTQARNALSTLISKSEGDLQARAVTMLEKLK
jgi:Tfp pilus assembly protein PilF